MPALDGLLLPLAIVTVLVAAPALAQPGDAEPAPVSAAEPCSAPAIGESLSCGCDVALASTPGSVWGSGPYTNDSDICVAAVHAGVASLIERGEEQFIVGSFEVSGGEGCERYPSGSANGVTTLAYGDWPASIYFPATQSGACPESSAASLNEDACPRVLPGDTKELSCSCSAEAVTTPADIWGADRYTADSHICRAALHAGAVSLEGGDVTVIRFGTGSDFPGTLRNDVQSLAWNSPFPRITFR